MVEHALQGEDTGIPIVDFIASDPRLAGRPKSEIAAMLLSVGFSDEKQQDPVASLSGGWKMKLELARAMLIGADILLLDEPTNHLGELSCVGAKGKKLMAQMSKPSLGWSSTSVTSRTLPA